MAAGGVTRGANLDATIVLPQHGQAELTLQCVRSLRWIEGELSPVIVVDDGSGDDSAERIRRANLPNCRLVEQPTSGVTAAWNTGLRHVETPVAILLNNDVVVHGRFLEQLVHPLRIRRASMAGVEWRRELLIPRSISTHLDTERLLAGWCIAFGIELWQRLGGFDDAMKVYYSDTDFQCRALEREFEAGLPSNPLHAAGPLPLRHLGHQTARRDPRRRLQWQLDRNAFLSKWTGRQGCSKSATSDASSAGRRRVPGR